MGFRLFYGCCEHLDTVNQGLFAAFGPAMNITLPAGWVSESITAIEDLERMDVTVTAITAPILNDCAGDLNLVGGHAGSGNSGRSWCGNRFHSLCQCGIPVAVVVSEGQIGLQVDAGELSRFYGKSPVAKPSMQSL